MQAVQCAEREWQVVGGTAKVPQGHPGAPHRLAEHLKTGPKCRQSWCARDPATELGVRLEVLGSGQGESWETRKGVHKVKTSS